jgi:hypothetical protein
VQQAQEETPRRTNTAQIIILFVFEPVARSPPNYVHADDSKMPGECGRQTIEIPAVARQPMDADNDSMLTWVSPFAVRNTMKTVRIECKKAMLVRLRCHVRLKILWKDHTADPTICGSQCQQSYVAFLCRKICGFQSSYVDSRTIAC